MSSFYPVRAEISKSTQGKVLVYLNNSVETADVVAANFAIDNGITVSNAAVVANTNDKVIELTTSITDPVAATLYTLTITSGVVNQQGSGITIDSPENTAVFAGYYDTTTPPEFTPEQCGSFHRGPGSRLYPGAASQSDINQGISKRAMNIGRNFNQGTN